jgi:hypothetical protein
MRRSISVLVLVVVAAGTDPRLVAEARLYAPRVVSPHNADAYSMKTFAQFPRWRDLKGDQLAWEVYKYLADARTGLFHMNEVLEGRDVLSEYRTIRDPVKIINVYGYGYCGIFGPVMAGICEGIGLGRGRTLVLPAWNHVASEAFYDGKWHYLDIDVRAVFRRADGSLASMADAQRDASLWKGRGPLFFPNDPLDATRKIYQQTAVNHYHGFNFSGHTMDYVLRQGEAFTRWWKPQRWAGIASADTLQRAGRWHHSPEFNKLGWLRKLILEEPRGPKPNHRDFTVHNYGNGRFVYRPNLTDRSTDFADGVYDSKNVRTTPAGLTLETPGQGYAVFEVRTPYVIVPIVGDLETTDDDREASVLEIDAHGAELSISLDNGLTWKELALAPVPKGSPLAPRAERGAGGEGFEDRHVAGRSAVLDLTPYVSGTYGYLLKIGLSGRPSEALVRRLGITTWVQVAPAALPSLRRGENRMEFRTGDHYGLPSRVVEIRSNASRPEELLKYLAEPPEDYDPARTTDRVHGPLVAKVEAPPGAKIAWFSAGAAFRTHQQAAARATRNTIAYAVDRPEHFREIYRAEVPEDNDHWNYNADREVRLDRPARTLYVRYVGDPALNNIRIYAHCVEDRPRPASPVRIHHVWNEGGVAKSKTFTLRERGSYTITCKDEPQDELIELAVPGVMRQATPVTDGRRLRPDRQPELPPTNVLRRR